jgi:hypothetical protein
MNVDWSVNCHIGVIYLKKNGQFITFLTDLKLV